MQNGTPLQAPGERWEGAQWEYGIILLKGDFSQALNQAGALGWELCAIANQTAEGTHVIAKRAARKIIAADAEILRRVITDG